MFKFLKDKLKSAISKISEGVEKEGKVEESIAEKPTKDAPKEKKGFFAKIKGKFSGKEDAVDKKEAAGEKKEEKIIEKEEKKPEEKHFSEPKKHEPIKEAKPSVEHKKEEIHEKSKASEIKKYIHAKKEETSKKHGLMAHKPEIKTEEKPHSGHDIKKITKHGHKSEIKEEKRKIIETKKEEAIQETKPAAKETPRIQEKIEAKEKPKEIEEPEKRGFFARLTEKITTTKINEVQFEKLFWDMELALMENNVAIEVIEKIKNDMKSQLVEKPIRRNKVEAAIILTLKTSIEELFQNNDFSIADEIKSKGEKPYVVAFFGINGSGKTTSIAKLANLLKEKGISCVLAAGDTFRAASIEQLSVHAEKIGIKIIKHTYGSDPAAVAFDAIKHAKAKNIDAVLIDTAGRMHSNENLIQEMKKIIRVAKPDLKIFVGESITGNDCVEQAKTFNEAVGIDGIILAKADIDEKGGAAISVSYVTKKPILYLGIGQEYKDLERFELAVVVKGLGLN